MAEYRVELKPSAERSLRKLPVEIQRRILVWLDTLKVNPRPVGVKKLAGETNTYRIRDGDYRIVYDLTDETLWVLVIRIGHRRDVYR